MKPALGGRALLMVFAVLSGIAGCREPNGGPGRPPGPVGDEAHAGGGTTPVPATLCNIEYVDGKMFATESVTVGSGAIVRGWLGSPDGTLSAPRLVVADDEGGVAGIYPLQLGIERPDVASAHPGHPDLERSGFEQALGALAGTPPFHLYLLYDSGAETYICDNGRHVVPAP